VLGRLEKEERSGLVRLVLGALGSEGQASLGAENLGERIRAKADSTRAPSFTGTLVAIDSLSLVCPRRSVALAAHRPTRSELRAGPSRAHHGHPGEGSVAVLCRRSEPQ